jgi:hypothetical protein
MQNIKLAGIRQGVWEVILQPATAPEVLSGSNPEKLAVNISRPLSSDSARGFAARHLMYAKEVWPARQ